jgi:uncharacterized membrane protein YdbT with pleckstrin-like domain
MSEPEVVRPLDGHGVRTMISVRQHWMALIRPQIIFPSLLACVFGWAAANPKFVIVFLHVTQEWPTTVLRALQTFFDYSFFFITLPLIFAVASALWTLGQWQFTSFKVDTYGLTYRLGPFFENTIPLRAIQDIRKTTSPLGLIFGYATLVIDAGREEATLAFVPEVDKFIVALRR